MLMRNQTVEATKEEKEIQKKTIMKEMFKMTKEQIQMQSIMKINPMGEGEKERSKIRLQSK